MSCATVTGLCREEGMIVTAPQALDRGLKLAIEGYEIGASNGPYLVASKVHSNVYEAWATKVESHWKMAFIKNEDASIGSVWLYGDPSRIHEAIPAVIVLCFGEQILCGQLRPLRGFTSADVLLPLAASKLPLRVHGYQINKEPDQAWVPACSPNALPSMVLEVAFSNESLPRLKQEMLWWSTNGCAVTLGIKIDMKRSNAGLNTKFIFLVLDQEENPSRFTEIDFSPGVCGDENQDEFVQHIPLRKIMRGFPTGVDPDFELELDLFRIQTLVLNFNVREPGFAEDDVCFCRHVPEDGGVVELSVA